MYNLIYWSFYLEFSRRAFPVWWLGLSGGTGTWFLCSLNCWTVVTGTTCPGLPRARLLRLIWALKYIMKCIKKLLQIDLIIIFLISKLILNWSRLTSGPYFSLLFDPEPYFSLLLRKQPYYPSFLGIMLSN